jgi:protein ImuA
MARADQRRRLARLRLTLARLEPAAPPAGRVLPLGLAALDRVLPGGGLRRGALHELHGAQQPGAAQGFAVGLLGRLMAAAGYAAWIGPRSDLFAPGLAALGLAPERLIVVRARGATALWALEEALRSPGLVAALAEVERIDLTASRRLQLAAEAKGVTALLLLRPPRAAGAVAGASAAATRWRITALPGRAGAGRALGPPAWRVELFRCRGGRTGVWQIGWREEGWHEIADPVLVAADARDRPAAQAGPR